MRNILPTSKYFMTTNKLQNNINIESQWQKQLNKQNSRSRATHILSVKFLI